MSMEVFGTGHVPLSHSVRAGKFVFVSWQVPVVGGKVVEGGIGPENRAVLENVKACPALAGAAIGDVVKTTVWLRDRNDFPAFNAVYAE
jgi:2-iminobutanoate/2-iminopropanoate deaminase